MIARSFKFFVVLLVTLSAAGCGGMMVKNYGSFEPDWEITKVFEGYQVNPNLNYYISGSDVHPHAIMGLDNNFTLEESLWKKVAMTPETLRTLVSGMRKRTDELNMSLWGFSMRDEGGREIGLWHSILFATTSVKFEGNNKFTVYRPLQNLYWDNRSSE